MTKLPMRRWINDHTRYTRSHYTARIAKNGSGQDVDPTGHRGRWVTAAPAAMRMMPPTIVGQRTVGRA